MADEPKPMIISIDRPIEIPGYCFLGDESGREILDYRLLGAGRYAVEIVDPASIGVIPASPRMVLRLRSLDRDFSTMIVGVADFRPVPSARRGLSYYKSRSGEPMALHGWFYPRGPFNIEFVYPEPQALGIARIGRERVIAARVPAVNKGVGTHPTLKDALLAPLIIVRRDGSRFALQDPT